MSVNSSILSYVRMLCIYLGPNVPQLEADKKRRFEGLLNIDHLSCLDQHLASPLMLCYNTLITALIGVRVTTTCRHERSCLCVMALTLQTMYTKA